MSDKTCTNILQYLELCRNSLDRESSSKRKYSEIDKARGTTERMHGYCCSHGLGCIPDLDVVWKRSKINHLWRVGVRRKNV